MEYTHEITLDLNPRIAPLTVYAKQGDGGGMRSLLIHLMKDGEEYEIDNNTSVWFRAQKPDGTVIARYPAEIEGNAIRVKLSQQTLAISGRVLADILLVEGNPDQASSAEEPIEESDDENNNNTENTVNTRGLLRDGNDSEPNSESENESESEPESEPIPEDNPNLSTASFIIVVERSPVKVMNQALSTNEIIAFNDCVAALSDSLAAVRTYAAAASESAQQAINAAAKDITIVPNSETPVLPSGVISGVFIRDNEVTETNNFLYSTPVPHFHPTANVLISGDTALFDVNVSSWSGAVPESEVSGLQVALDFNLTIPEYDVNIALDPELVASDKAAQAKAVGDRFDNLDPGSIGITSASPLGTEFGGIGVSIDTAASSSAIATAQANACTNIGAQRAIQVYSTGSLASGAEWEYDIENAIYSQALYVPLNGINLDRVPEFVASPKDIGSWNEAADIGMGPPTAAAPTTIDATDPTNWQLTFQAESSSTKNINITVYWW